MKKNLITLGLLMFMSCFIYSQTISGIYSTDFKQLTLNVNGKTITGTYDNNNGKINALLYGNTLIGTWVNTGSKKSGKLEFVFNSDFTAFTGKWNYNDASLSRKWNGTKTKSTSTSTVVQTPVISPTTLANISGSYTTDFGKMTLQQSGNKVTGKYEGGNGTITGIINGNSFKGTWKNSSNSRSGNFDFVFNSGFSSFIGKYGYNNDSPSRKWNGTKTTSESTPTVVQTPSAQESLPINIFGSWAHRGAKDQDDRLNIWQEGNRFIIVISWIDINTKIWKSYMGEGQIEGRKMNFKVFPSMVKGKTIDQGYMYHYTISSDNNLITGYYTHNGKRNLDANWHYQRVTE